MAKKRLFVLASGSPRRRELLGIAGFMFSTLRVNIDESPLENEPPDAYVRRVSELKVMAAVPAVNGLPIILGVDTTVADGRQILGKPASAKEAEQMLKQLRGRTHQVYSGLTVVDMETGYRASEVARTDVPMREYTDEEIYAYIASGNPFDKAGAYAIQNADFHPVLTRTGCYANVIGLPLCHLLRALLNMELTVSQDIPYLCQTAHNYECGVFSTILNQL